LFALQFRHINWVHFGWSRFATAQKFAGITTHLASASKIFTEAARLELHLIAAFVAFDGWAVITFYFEYTFFDYITLAIWTVATDMQLTLFVQQIAVHGRITFSTAPLAAQLSGFRLFVVIDVNRFVTRDEIHGVLTAFLWRQGVA